MKASTAALTLSLIASASSTPVHPRADTSGCGIPHRSGFNSNPDSHTITSGGRSRTYAVRVPDNYNADPNKPRKLIFDFHGRGGTPESQYNNSRYDTYDDGKEYLAVYPAGISKAWQGAPYATKGVDDTLFVADLLAHLRTQYCIDSNHVYASGQSNGGGFTDTLACSDVGDQFAAFAMSAAALYDDLKPTRCNKKRAILESHGAKDETIYYGGGHTNSGGDVPAIKDWVSWWGERNGCAADSGRTNPHQGYDTTTFKCAASGDKVVVKHYRVEGLGHCWPSSTGENEDSKRSVCKDRSLDYTPRVLSWFGSWDLGSAPKN